jgi:hypothetical protein
MSNEQPSAGWRAYLDLDDRALLAQCEVDRFRASGPGGQHRNVTDSAVRLRHVPTGAVAQAFEARSQHQNRARALRRLRVAIALSVREPVDLERYAPPPPLDAAIRRGGIEMGRRDARWPATAAAVLDIVEACDWRISDAATQLGISTAALSRFLTGDEELLRAANGRRQALGLRPLRPR